MAATADFAYIRFHGNQDLYFSRYSDYELKKWAEKIRKLPMNVKDVYVYFNIDAGAAATANAFTLRKLLE
jgi:uncharacterized protein YecE (DUF72 family)